MNPMIDASTLRNLAISDTGFVFEPRSGATFTLNATGLVVLLALRDGAGVDQIVDKLKQGFDGANGGTREDVVDFVQTLRAQGLLGPHRST